MADVHGTVRVVVYQGDDSAIVHDEMVPITQQGICQLSKTFLVLGEPVTMEFQFSPSVIFVTHED